MIVPSVGAWIKERNHRSRFRIDAREIRSFVSIASITRQCETGTIVGTAVLFRNNMFQVESNQWRYQLVKPAILTSVLGPVAN
jgi:hypothetical protein